MQISKVSKTHNQGNGAIRSHNFGGGFTSSNQTGLSISTLRFFSNNMVNYSGPLGPFVLQFNNITAEERLGVKILNMTITGDMIQEASSCCVLATIIAGGCCILPIFLFCCNCYKQAVSELRNLPVESYMAIESVILQCPNIEKALVKIYGNMFDPSKAQILERSIVRLPKLFVFEFTNQAVDLNLKNNEYDSFDQCFPLTKQSNRFVYSLRWGTKLTAFNNPQVQVAPPPYNQQSSQVGFHGNFQNQANSSPLYPPIQNTPARIQF